MFVRRAPIVIPRVRVRGSVWTWSLWIITLISGISFHPVWWVICLVRKFQMINILIFTFPSDRKRPTVHECLDHPWIAMPDTKRSKITRTVSLRRHVSHRMARNVSVVFFCFSLALSQPSWAVSHFPILRPNSRLIGFSYLRAKPLNDPWTELFEFAQENGQVVVDVNCHGYKHFVSKSMLLKRSNLKLFPFRLVECEVFMSLSASTNHSGLDTKIFDGLNTVYSSFIHLALCSR